MNFGNLAKPQIGMAEGKALANFGNHGVAESCIAAGNVEGLKVEGRKR